MRHSIPSTYPRSGIPVLRAGPLFLTALASAAAGLLVAVLLLSPPREESLALATYFTLSGLATLAGARGMLWLFDRVLHPSLTSRTKFVATLGPAIALANVAIVAQLMFVSTGHDLRLLVALIVLGGIVSVAFASAEAASVMRRVDRIADRVRRLADGDYREAARGDLSGDEIDRLGCDIEELAQRLRHAERQRELLDRERQELTAAISHDLRTPLTNIRAMVEALEDGVVHEGGDVTRYYRAIQQETGRLDSMVDDLLELARLDAGVLELNLERVTPDVIARDVVESMRVVSSSKNVALTLTGEERLPPLDLDRRRIERALTNLVKNAVEHSPPGGSVLVSVGRDGDEVQLRVTDSGPGIAETDLPYIWTRFYRGNASRSRRANEPGGTGLGLAITRGFVEAHGGSVSVESAPGGHGSRFTIRL